MMFCFGKGCKQGKGLKVFLKKKKKRGKQNIRRRAEKRKKGEEGKGNELHRKSGTSSN